MECSTVYHVFEKLHHTQVCEFILHLRSIIVSWWKIIKSSGSLSVGLDL